ncbi:MAG: hypothetical protein KatS3mg027_0080 [Bacteroidia bacterium]|nr:MAG: hypothetical protein KatS3mg027_0080 [Bacteroidia bacterium]
MKFELVLFLVSINLIFAQNNTLSREEEDRRANTPVPFTLADRDRILKLEVRSDELKKDIENLRQETKKDIENLRQEMLLRFEALEKKYDMMFTILYGLIVALFGYIVWDRRTFMKPLEAEVHKLKAEADLQKKLENDNKQLGEKLLGVLKELAANNEEIRKALQKFHLL